MPYLIALLLFGLSLVGVGAERYLAGKKAERAVQEMKITRMLLRHQQDVNEANARTSALEEQWRLARQGADRVQESERARTRAALAAVAADRDRLRDQLATFAAGGGQAGPDTLAACHDRAAALGRVLGEALQTSAQCAGDAEDLAAGQRALRAAWPVASP